VAGPRKRNGKSQRFSVRISSLEGLLVDRGEFTLIFPGGPVKPFHTQFRGGSVWKLLRWLQEGQRFQEWSKNEDQKRWEPGHAPVSVAICLLHFLFPRSSTV